MKHNNIIIILLSVIIFTTCKTERKKLTGSISGNVKIIAENGYYQPDAIAKVSILNTELSVQTGTDGFYKINDIPVGTYNIKYSSEGFEDYIERGVNINQGTNPYLLKDVVLGQKPVSVIKNLRSYTYGFGNIRIAGDISPPGDENNRKQICLYIDDENTVSKDNYSSLKYLVSVADTFYVDYTNLNINMDGDSVYFVAYTKSFNPMDFPYEYSFNCDEYNMNCNDFTISDTPSNIISLPLNKK